MRGKERGDLLVILCEDGGQRRQLMGDALDQQRLGGEHGHIGSQRFGLREQLQSLLDQFLRPTMLAIVEFAQTLRASFLDGRQGRPLLQEGAGHRGGEGFADQ